jgi:hypothetical protein
MPGRAFPIPIQAIIAPIVLVRATAKLKTWPLTPPTVPSSSSATIATVKPANAATYAAKIAQDRGNKRADPTGYPTRNRASFAGKMP